MRDLPRIHDIATVMIRYGWGDLVRMLGMARFLERTGRILHWQSSNEIARLPAPVRARRALEDLGPTFIKLGQILATRVDMFPPEWIAEFEKLHREVPPVPFEQVRADLEAALGGAPENVFARFNAEPIAAASIAQVYRAELADGSKIVLKVRRPGIEEKIAADLRILEHLARLIESEVQELRRYDPQRIVSEFRRSLKRELDLWREARNIELFARHFSDDDTVVIPRVYRQYSTAKVLAMEEIDGIAGVDPQMLRDSGLDPVVLGARGATTVLKMVLMDGYFHADPHPGNVIFLPGNRIGMIDFGMVGRLTDTRREQIVSLLHALSRKDEDGMMQVLLDWAGEGDIDQSRLGHDLSDLVYTYDDLQLQDVRVADLLADITTLMRENNLALPADLTLLFKALITLEGLGQQLNPAFNMLDHMTPFVEQVVRDRYRPAALVKRGRKGIQEIGALLAGLPRDLARLMGQMRRGRMRIDLDLKRLDHFGQQLDRSSNRLTMGILTASLVIGSSIIMTVKGGPELLGLPLFGLLGFLVAFFNSVWIIFSIWRSGKH